MKILITGGAGYLGSVLIGRLFTAHPRLEKVVVVDSLVRNQNTMGPFCNDPRFEFIRGDITDMGLMLDILDNIEPFDYIIPLAGIVGAPRCEFLKAQAWMINATAVSSLLLELKPEQKIIYPCTNSGYGTMSDGSPVTEDSPLTPVSTYGRTKVMAEKSILEHGGVSLRLATVMGYSPCMRLDLLVNNFVWNAVKDRNIVLFEKGFRRNYVHVEDVCKAFLLAIHKYELMSGQAYNVGLSSANLTKEQLAHKIAEHTECHIIEAPLMKDPDKRDYLVSNEKIEALGFKPAWDMDKTIQQLIKFYNTVNLQSANVFYENWK
jgi:nucleoside-diphosphate-sugar epimerase